jgi:hypothetical protein
MQYKGVTPHHATPRTCGALNGEACFLSLSFSREGAGAGAGAGAALVGALLMPTCRRKVDKQHHLSYKATPPVSMQGAA